MRLEDRFTVEAPIDEVYATLLDLDKVTPCVPGAELISTSGDVSTVGIRVRVGPISMQYRGDVEIIERDPAAHRAVMKVTAREVRGQGTAEARAELRLSQEGATTAGDVQVDVDISGRAASMGQGAIQDVSSKLVGRFARNLTRMLETPAAANGAASSFTPEPEDDTLSGGEIAATVIAGRLKNPVVLGGLLAVVAGIAALIGRRLAR